MTQVGVSEYLLMPYVALWGEGAKFRDSVTFRAIRSKLIFVQREKLPYPSRFLAVNTTLRDSRGKWYSRTMEGYFSQHKGYFPNQIITTKMVKACIY